MPSLNSNLVYEELERLRRHGDDDPAAVIGTAKDLVEACCKHVLDQHNIAYDPRKELPALIKAMTKAIKIMPQDISDDARAAPEVRAVLSSLGKIAHAMGPIRNAYGTGHGRGGQHKGLERRHARLAAGAAITFAEFVLDRSAGVLDAQ